MPPGPQFNQAPQPTIPEKKLVGVLASGEHVFDRVDSHIDDHPEVKQHLAEALKRISPEGKDFSAETVQFEEPIGENYCVETHTSDEILYAQRPKRFGKTRFVKNRTPEPTSQLTVVLKKERDAYVVISAYLGSQAGPEPWSKFADEQSIAFWNTHALVWGSQETIPGTESLTP
jgi:hypothetical protein